jgi:hypothetical protein
MLEKLAYLFNAKIKGQHSKRLQEGYKILYNQISKNLYKQNPSVKHRALSHCKLWLTYWTFFQELKLLASKQCFSKLRTHLVCHIQLTQWYQNQFFLPYKPHVQYITESLALLPALGAIPFVITRADHTCHCSLYKESMDLSITFIVRHVPLCPSF